MRNETLIEFIKEKYYEEKMSAEYRLQLTKIVELEDKFTKDFPKDKWREYFNLDLEKGKHLGRPKLPLPKNFNTIANEYKKKEITLAEALLSLNMNRSTFYKNLDSSTYCVI